jgi:hypothetical protein
MGIAVPQGAAKHVTEIVDTFALFLNSQLTNKTAEQANRKTYSEIIFNHK